MSLNFTNKQVIGAVLVDAWQNHLNTEMDPADGQWFTNGPGNNGGLYGQLTDALATELVFDNSQSVFTPHQVAAVTGTADNRDGLTPNQTVTLSYTYQNATTVTHSTTDSLKVTAGTDISAKTDFFGTGGGVTVRFSIEYSYSWTDSTTTSESESKTFQQQVPVTTPTGKVYQVTLMCNNADLKLPCYADIYLTGQSTANFRSPVNGEQIWTVDAGTLCEWITKFGSAGADSYMYCRNPNNPMQGLIRLRGMLTATQTVNFTAVTKDITSSFEGTQPPRAMSAVAHPANVATVGDVIATQAFG